MRRRKQPIICGKECLPEVPNVTSGRCLLAPNHEGRCADAVCVAEFSDFQRVAEALLRKGE